MVVVAPLFLILYKGLPGPDAESSCDLTMYNTFLDRIIVGLSTLYTVVLVQWVTHLLCM